MCVFIQCGFGSIYTQKLMSTAYSSLEDTVSSFKLRAFLPSDAPVTKGPVPSTTMRHGFCLRWSQPRYLLPKLTCGSLEVRGQCSVLPSSVLLVKTKTRAQLPGKQCRYLSWGSALRGSGRGVSGLCLILVLPVASGGVGWEA